MKKVALAEVPSIPADHPDLTGVRVKTVISRDTVGAKRGMLSIAEFAVGGVHTLHRHDSSAQISYLLSGKGEHLTENGPIAIEAGDATYVPRNSWHGFRNTGTDKAFLLSIYSPAAHLADAGYETYRGEIDRSKPAKVALASLASARGDTIGSNRFLLGANTLEPGHRHEAGLLPQEDEFLYILEGSAVFLGTGSTVALSAGDVAYLLANENRALKNQEGAMTRMLFGYFGPVAREESAAQTHTVAHS